MTSMPSRDDVESALWQAGIRDARQVRRIMRVIDTYTMGIKRLYEHTRLLEPFGYLRPGESDIGMEVTKCKECEVPKKFTQFHIDKSSPTGHRDICKKCAGTTRKPLAPPDYNLELTCSVCGETMPAEPNFYRRSDTKNGYAKRCKDCMDGVRRCPGCDKRRRTSSYAPDARVCIWCEGKR